MRRRRIHSPCSLPAFLVVNVRYRPSVGVTHVHSSPCRLCRNRSSVFVCLFVCLCSRSVSFCVFVVHWVCFPFIDKSYVVQRLLLRLYIMFLANELFLLLALDFELTFCIGLFCSLASVISFSTWDLLRVRIVICQRVGGSIASLS